MDTQKTRVEHSRIVTCRHHFEIEQDIHTRSQNYEVVLRQQFGNSNHLALAVEFHIL